MIPRISCLDKRMVVLAVQDECIIWSETLCVLVGPWLKLCRMPLQKTCEFVLPLYSLHATKSQKIVGQPKYEWEIVTCDCLAQRPICFQIPSGDLSADIEKFKVNSLHCTDIRWGYRHAPLREKLFSFYFHTKNSKRIEGCATTPGCISSTPVSLRGKWIMSQGGGKAFSEHDLIHL